MQLIDENNLTDSTKALIALNNSLELLLEGVGEVLDSDLSVTQAIGIMKRIDKEIQAISTSENNTLWVNGVMMEFITHLNLRYMEIKIEQEKGEN